MTKYTEQEVREEADRQSAKAIIYAEREEMDEAAACGRNANMLTQLADMLAEREKAHNDLPRTMGEILKYQLDQRSSIAKGALGHSRPAAQPRVRASEWRQAFISERARHYVAEGMKIEQARIHAEADAVSGEALLAAQPRVPDGYVMVPIKPTEAMHNAARDWSRKKYGQAIGNDASTGCWKAMLLAAQESGR